MGCHFSLRMLGKIGRTPSILLSMVNTKYGASLVGSEDPVSMAIGLFYGKKIENQRRGTNSNSRKKLFTEEKKSPVVKKQKNSNVSFSRKKVIFKTNSPTKCLIRDKLTKRQDVHNGKSADTLADSKNTNHKLKELLQTHETNPPKQKTENIYQKVYTKNLRKIRNSTKNHVELNKVNYRITNVRIDLVKHKLSTSQLRDLRLQGFLKQRRQASLVKKSGIPVLIISEGSSTIQDSVVRGVVSRIPHSLRYIKPSHTADDYGLGNKQDIEFDDEDCPRKVIPRWAQGELLEQALVEQEEVDVSNMIFSVCEPPNLDLMFPQAATKRDIWRTPPSSYSSRLGHRVEEKQGGSQEELVRFVTDRLVNKNC